MKFEIDIPDDELDTVLIMCMANHNTKVWSIRDILILLKEKLE